MFVLTYFAELAKIAADSCPCAESPVLADVKYKSGANLCLGTESLMALKHCCKLSVWRDEKVAGHDSSADGPRLGQ